MKFQFRTVIHPSGYEFNEEHKTIHPKKFERWYEASFDFDELINDVWQRFKHVETSSEHRFLDNYLSSRSNLIIKDGSIENDVDFKYDGIEKVKTLCLKYGLNRGPEIYFNRMKEIRKGIDDDLALKYHEGMEGPEKDYHLAVMGDYYASWEEIIFKIIQSVRYPENNNFIEIDNVKMLITNNELNLFPMSLDSAISCYTTKKGIAPCDYCGTPFLKKRSNQIYCSTSCKANSNRDKRVSKG